MVWPCPTDGCGQGKNRRGRLKKRWKDKLMKDMTGNGIEEEHAQDRQSWKQILKDIFD